MRSGVALLFVAGLAACGAVAGSMDAKSEGDQARDQALALFLDRTMTDSVDGEGGDNTDWKYIDIVDKGGLRVDVGMDAPEGLKGAEIELFDEFGKRLDRRLVMPNQTSYSFEVEVDKVPNKYFVRTFTAEGRSTYSIGARLAPDPGQPEPRRVVEARPEPEQPVDEPDPEPDEPDPEVTFPNIVGDLYPVQLVVWNELGCADTLLRYIPVEDAFLIHAPNSFTPNGDDLNETFSILGNDLSRDEFTLDIFDRWGRSVFSSTTPDLGWDGKVNGTAAEVGVYVWRLKARSVQTLEKHILYGHVSLLR